MSERVAFIKSLPGVCVVLVGVSGKTSETALSGLVTMITIPGPLFARGTDVSDGAPCRFVLDGHFHADPHPGNLMVQKGSERCAEGGGHGPRRPRRGLGGDVARRDGRWE